MLSTSSYLFSFLVFANQWGSALAKGIDASGFQGWVKSYCDGPNTSDPYVIDHDGCSTDEAYYQLAAGGVRFKTLRDGTGRSVQSGDVLVVQFLGWVFDPEDEYSRGPLFDSSYHIDRRPFEFTFGAKRVIPGWGVGVAQMKVGELREIIIPPDMAYGNRAIGELIPPNSTLVYEIELVQIKSAE